MIELPKRDGTMYAIDGIALSKLRGAYPTIDVEAELRKMRAWLDANPRNRKKDMHRFVVNWLNRAKPLTSGSVTSQTSQHYAIVAERMRKPAEPARYAPPEVAQSHISDLRKMLGMRRQQA